MYHSTSIKLWEVNDRPREKLLKQGKRVLSNAELLAILLGSGNQEENALQLGQRILASAKNNLKLLGKMDADQLIQFKGVGHAKAITLIAALELGRRRQYSEVLELEKIQSARDVFLVMNELESLAHEEFWVLYLNRANKLMDRQRISSGGIAGTVVDQRLVFKKAINLLACSIVLVHNHPSGNLQPSKADITLTNKLRAAGQLIDIKILDHLIIAETGYFSFADEGLM